MAQSSWHTNWSSHECVSACDNNIYGMYDFLPWECVLPNQRISSLLQSALLESAKFRWHLQWDSVMSTVISPFTCLSFSIELPLNGITDHLEHTLGCPPREMCPWALTSYASPLKLSHRQVDPEPHSCLVGSPPLARHHWNRTHPCFNKNEFYPLIDSWWPAGKRKESHCFKCLCVVGHLMFRNQTDQPGHTLIFSARVCPCPLVEASEALCAL